MPTIAVAEPLPMTPVVIVDRIHPFSSPAMAMTPTELWAEIFGLASRARKEERSPETDRNILPSRRTQVEPARLHPPWSFLTVCKRFNEIALGHSALWTDVRVPLRPRDSKTAVPPKEVARILEWSKTRPLSVSLVTQSHRVSLDTLDVLLAETGRMEGLSLSCRPDDGLIGRIFTRQRILSWNVLKTLEINFLSTLWPNVPSVIDLRMLPALQTFIERGAGRVRTKVLLPLHTVKAMRLSLPMGYISAQLGFATMLTSLEVFVQDPNRQVDLATFGLTAYEGVLLPNVRTVKVKNCLSLLQVIGGRHLVSLALETSGGATDLEELRRVLGEARFSMERLLLSSPNYWEYPRLADAVWQLDKLQEFTVEVKLPVEIVLDFVDDDTLCDIWTYGVRMLLTGLEALGEGVILPCPALRSCEVKYAVPGTQMLKDQREWLLEGMTHFVCTLCPRLQRVVASRNAVGAPGVYPRVGWRVGDHVDGIEGKALLTYTED